MFSRGISPCNPSGATTTFHGNNTGSIFLQKGLAAPAACGVRLINNLVQTRTRTWDQAPPNGELAGGRKWRINVRVWKIPCGFSRC